GAPDSESGRRAIPKALRYGTGRDRLRKVRGERLVSARVLEMKIDRVILRQIPMPLVHFFGTSFGRTIERHMVLVEVMSGGVSGWGEVTAGENPFYNEEWTGSAWLILRDYAAPLVLSRPITSAMDVHPLTSRIRGHLMARAGLETAVWD